MNRFDRILRSVKTARGYETYIPGEGEEPYPEEDEVESFNSVLDSIEREVKMLKHEHEDED